MQITINKVQIIIYLFLNFNLTGQHRWDLHYSTISKNKKPANR